MSRPASSSRLFLRGKIFYFRLRLKNPFPDFFNKAEIRISTGTPYRSVALKFSAAMEIFMVELLARLSKGEAISNLSNIDLMRYARIYYAENIEVINVLSLHNAFDDSVVEDIVNQKEKVKNMLKYNDYGEIHPQVDEFVCKHCPDVTKNSYDYLKVANALAKSMFDLNQIIESRAVLDFDKEEKIISKYEMIDSVKTENFTCFEQRNSIEKEIPGNSIIKKIKLKEAIDDYIDRIKDRANDKEVDDGTPADLRSRLNWLEFVIGPEKNVCDIEYVDMVNYAKILKKMPGNRTKKVKYRDKSLDELLEMDLSGKDVLSVGTINTITQCASTFFKDCVLNNYMYQNLAVNISVKDNTRDDERRDPFTPEDVTVILDGIKGKSSKMRNDWNYWIFMLGLFTGGRLTEICQLYAKDDIQQMDGIWYIDINQNETENPPPDAITKKLKNLSSKRKVPIHPKLIELGFIDFVLERQKTNDTMLFRNITLIKERNLSDKPSTYASKLIRGCGIVSKSKVFHSFRHTFKKQLKDAEVAVDIRDELCGHENKSASCLYYDSPTFMKKLYDGICNIHFDYDFDSINFYKLKEIKRSKKSKK